MATPTRSTNATTSAPPPEAVGPLLRGLAVLRALAAGGGGLSAGELTRLTGQARSTVDRTLGTLARLDQVRWEGRAAVLAPRLMEVGNAYLAACRLPELLGGRVDELADALDESVSLAVPDGDGVRFVHQATRRRAMSLAFRLGDPLPAECGAPGALFAAGWGPEEWAHWRARRAADPDRAAFPAVPPGAAARGAASFDDRVAAAARTGRSEDDQLIEPGLIAIALPVRGGDGRPVCAASVVSHTSRHSPASLRRALLPPLRRAVAAMERTLAAPPPPADPGSAAGSAPGSVPDGPSAATRVRAAKRELGAGFVESLARGLAVLASFDAAHPARTLGELARATGLARATVRRSLITLEHTGHIARAGDVFRPLPRVLELGFAELSTLTLPRIAGPHLARLVERVHESASLSVLAGDDIQYVARVPTVRVMSVDITVGTRFPAYATSMGRVLLADLPTEERAARLGHVEPLTRHTVTDRAELAAVLDRAAREGHALVDGELEEGLRSLAVPVRDRASRAVAAVNVSMHAAHRTAAEARATLLPPLREAAAAIEADLHVAGRFVPVRPM
ncbi:IclR family transcriptional regulator C-terminal domain-containing protein [Streptomyces radicis]|uniref:IclR family transcriptional regulator n=1 Tax=Streptomyces radicis TaxID=1750517 RepID=A0A3A9W9A2_9ACTN|nr:IclR family transcriptional regulator C-terminal domain-containing protein [Streptomyces radicis]RKN05954.1 IclR family transcriptional regulator [Streptomyces radicis]RKN17740.1 IclR family transcriptional regulator [Streptomyces radicis]